MRPTLSYTTSWAVAFLATYGVETGAVCVLLPNLRRDEPWHLCGAVLAAQLVSHPCVWFVFPHFGLPRPAYLAVAESFALVSEAVLYGLTLGGLGWRRAWAISAVANAASWGVGTAFLGLRQMLR